MIRCRLDNDGVAVFGRNDEETKIPKERLIDLFHNYYYVNFGNHSGPQMRYCGVPIHKHPCDMFNYQQIIYEQQPDFIVECGAFQGGGTLFFANTLDLIGKGRVISIDICEREGVWHEKVRQHERTVLLAGSSTDPEIVARVREIVGGATNNFVILDSLHTTSHVLQEMEAYADLLASGNYLVVEDSNLNGHPVFPAAHPETMEHGGPFEAIEEFMARRDDFYIDKAMEKRFLFSFAASGYLVKK